MRCSECTDSRKNSVWDSNAHGWHDVPSQGLCGVLLPSWDLHVSHYYKLPLAMSNLDNTVLTALTYMNHKILVTRMCCGNKLLTF